MHYLITVFPQTDNCVINCIYLVPCFTIPQRSLDQAQKKRKKSLAVKDLRKREKKRRRRRRQEAILKKCLSSQLVSNVKQVPVWCVMAFLCFPSCILVGYFRFLLVQDRLRPHRPKQLKRKKNKSHFSVLYKGNTNYLSKKSDKKTESHL